MGTNLAILANLQHLVQNFEEYLVAFVTMKLFSLILYISCLFFKLWYNGSISMFNFITFKFLRNIWFIILFCLCNCIYMGTMERLIWFTLTLNNPLHPTEGHEIPLGTQHAWYQSNWQIFSVCLAHNFNTETKIVFG